MWGALPSRRPFCGLGKGQAAKVVRRLGCLAAGCKECPFVGLQKLNPVGDIARVPDVPVKAKLGAQERGAQLRNQFLGGVGPRAPKRWRQIAMPAATCGPLQCPLCRSRHNTHYADLRIMPRRCRSRGQVSRVSARHDGIIGLTEQAVVVPGSESIGTGILR